MKKKKVVVFSAAFGAGHIRAAEAIIEEIQKQNQEFEIVHSDFGFFINKSFYNLLKVTYLGLIKHAPKIWGKFYYDTAAILQDSTFQTYLNKMGRSKVLKYLNSLQPELIICTYPIVSGVIAQLKSERLTNIPLATIVTDYAVHSQWVHENVDLYIVGCEDVYHNLIGRGIDPNRIQITGIPVSPKFELPQDRISIMEGLGLNPDKLTVLIMSGAFGVLKDLRKMCKIFTDSHMPVQAIVVCGKDETLYKSLDEIIEKAQNPILRFGFVDNVEDLMSVSDIIITKAGGLTVTEALSKRLPMIIYKPIPGQEAENAMFLVENGSALIANKPSDIKQIINSIFSHPAKLENMRRAAAQALPGRAAERAVAFMLQLMKKYNIKENIG